MSLPVILAFLQNQWFKNPEKVKAILAKRAEDPGFRNEFIRRSLFRGCLTGKRLRAAFGEKLCHQIIWEEASPEIGGKSAANFDPDLIHMRMALEKHQPKIILAFGANARSAMEKIRHLNHPCPNAYLLYGPHPAARESGVLPHLKWMHGNLDRALARCMEDLRQWHKVAGNFHIRFGNFYTMSTGELKRSIEITRDHRVVREDLVTWNDLRTLANFINWLACRRADLVFTGAEDGLRQIWKIAAQTGGTP